MSQTAGAAKAWKSESVMNKSPLGVVQRVANSVWRAVRMLEVRPAPISKAKLNGRRGYGDDGITSPDQTPHEK